MDRPFTLRACLAAAVCVLALAGCSNSETASSESVSPAAPRPIAAGRGKILPGNSSAGIAQHPVSESPENPGPKPTASPTKNATPSPEPAASSASSTPAAIAPVTISERLLDEPTRRVLKLSNGFTIILQQNKTAPIVAARIYVKAGSMTEQQYMGAGISHVLEHLVAGATSGKRKEAENALLLQQIGNDSNAYTDYDHTCYFITTSKEKWPVALDLLADWTTDADFTPAQFAREYQVVQRELEMGQAEALRTFYIHTGFTRYLESPARNPVIGYKPAFQKLTYKDAKAYYKEMYVPDNMIVSIAGDIDLDAAEKLALKDFSGVERKAVPAIANPPEQAVLVPRTDVSHADVKQARIMWTFPTTNLYSPDLYATDVLSLILAGGDSSPLVEKIRDQQGLVVDINCTNDTPRYAPGGLEIVATLEPGKILAAQKAVLAVLADVVKNGVTEEQLKRAKAQAAASLVYDNQTAEQQAIRNGYDFLSTGTIDFSTVYVHRLEKVTAQDVQAVAKKYLVNDRLLTTALLPLNAHDPFAVTAAAAGETARENVTKKVVLKNGLTVLVTPNSAAPLVTFNMYTLGGLLAEKPADNGIGNAMMQLLVRGTTTRSHEQIAAFLDSTATSLAADSGSNTFSLSAQCLKKNAGAAFDLFADVILHPKFAPDELEQLRPQLLAAVDQSSEDWFEEAYAQAKKEYYAVSPYRELPVGTAAVISKLTPEQIRAHYQTYFLDPHKTVLAIAGDIDEAAAVDLAKKLEAIPEPASPPPLAVDSTSSPAHVIAEHTAKKSATILFCYPPGSQVDSADRYALMLLQTHLGGYSSPGGSVLHETLREKGLVYTVQASVIPAATKTGGGMFLISALGQPDKTTQIIDTVKQIIEHVKTHKISDQELAAAKDEAITGELLSKQTIADKSSARALNELLGLGYDEDTRLPAALKKVTADDILHAAQKYLHDPTIVTLTPEQK